MPRQARQKSESGVYHIMLRGINGQVIFEDEQITQGDGSPVLTKSTETGIIIQGDNYAKTGTTKK